RIDPPDRCCTVARQSRRRDHHSFRAAGDAPRRSRGRGLHEFADRESRKDRGMSEPTISRAAVEKAIDALIDLLDQIDGDTDREIDEPDMEHDGREPIGETLMWGAA